ncbi:MAG: CapA family protein [Actinobacteria bacterium]|nr:CapA family protein [Actinomycetota bacterium]
MIGAEKQGAAAEPPQGTRAVELRPPAGPTARLLVAGDLAVPAGVLPGGAEHPWAPLASYIGAHDLAVVNLECPLTERGSAIAKLGPSLSGEAALAAVARDGGFGAASLANNHIMDRGPDGLRDTLQACADAGLATVGAGADLAAASEPLVASVGAVSVAVVAVAEREFSIAGARRCGAAPLDPWATPALVRRLRDRGHVVVAIVHGGNELYGLPRPGLVAACRALADAGAAAVVCHHSHVAAPWEVHEGVPIVYGTGNFLFPASSGQASPWYRGYLASLTLDAGGVTDLRFTGYVQGGDGPRVRPMGPRAADAWHAHLDGLATTLADPAALDRAWRAFCRTRRPYVLASVLGLSRVERGLLKAGIWPAWRLPRRRVPELFDMVVCESHREVLEHLLEEEMAR